jgi:hypothetical protein
MIQPIEKQMLFWAARDHYLGLGEIVELGTFLGTSTECLCKGLQENQQVKTKAERVHCYDLFTRSEYVSASYAPWLDRHKISVGGSFLPVVEHNLAAYRQQLVINPGDVMRQAWLGRPIEVLFVDMAVSWTLSDQVVRRFFPALMPGRSLVIHQDYLFQLAPWLAITMEYFADYFGTVGNADCSMVFQLLRPIPDDLMQRGTEALLPQHKLALNERATQRYGGVATVCGAIVALQRAALLATLGDAAGAERLAREILASNRDATVAYRGKSLLENMPAPSWRA